MCIICEYRSANPSGGDDITDFQVLNLSTGLRELNCANCPNLTSIPDLPADLQEEAMGLSYHLGGGKTGFYRRLSWDEPSPTLVTRPNMPATDLCHPQELRPLSVQEYKAIQQFPNEWWFAGNIIEQYKQIGNAVPVGFGHTVGKAIIDFHTGKTTKEEQNVVRYSRYHGTTDIDFESKQLELVFNK